MGTVTDEKQSRDQRVLTVRKDLFDKFADMIQPFAPDERAHLIQTLAVHFGISLPR